MSVTDGRRIRRSIQREPSLREQVSRSLRFALFTGALPPGRTFSVPALAEEYGVSATPVREAVLDLVQRGLVAPMPSKGFRVVDPSPRTVRETLETRRLLEVPTTRRIAETISPRDLDRLRAMAEATVAAAALGDTDAFVEADYDFHRFLVSLCGNDTLVEMIEDLRSRARVQMGPLFAQAKWLVEAADEHVRLVEAMAAKDLAVVEEVVLLHMSHALAVPRAVGTHDTAGDQVAS